MQLRDGLELLRSRVSIISYGLAIVLGVLVFGFWQLQVVQKSHYADLADKNRIKEIRLVAARGKIYDRYHKILADNRPSYNIIYIRENSPHKPEETIAALANGLGMSAEELTQKIDRKKKDPPYQPITLKEDAGTGDVAYVMAHAYELPEVSVEYQPRRLYREGRLAAHALGYIGEVTDEKVEALKHFAKTVYLSQTVECRGDHLEHYLNLEDAFAGWATDKTPRQWRSHFHVPVFLTDLGPMKSTQFALEQALAMHKQTPLSRHLEIETYTWDVLPDHLKTGDIVEYVCRELEWVKGQLA